MFESMLFPLLHVSFIKFSFCTPSFYPYFVCRSFALSFCRLAIFIFSCYCFSFIRRHDIFRLRSLSLCVPLRLVLAAAALAARSPISSWWLSRASKSGDGYLVLCMCFSEKEQAISFSITMWLWLREHWTESKRLFVFIIGITGGSGERACAQNNDHNGGHCKCLGVSCTTWRQHNNKRREFQKLMDLNNN